MSVQLKPLDEPWMFRALGFVDAYCRSAGHGPTWGELWAHMRWPRHSCSPSHRMNKLRKRGLEWDDGVERSLRVSPAALEQLKSASRRA